MRYSYHEMELPAMKLFLSACLVVILISGIAFAGALQFGTAQSGTNFNGIISSDTTWTQADSPFTLTGPVGSVR
jgi:hypothetical protein